MITWLKPSQIILILEKNVKRFSKPKRLLEQYRTPPEIAVEIALWLRSIGCEIIVDLGTGTGMIAFASSLLGFYVVGVDIDLDALIDATESRLYNSLVVDFIQADVRYLPLRRGVSDRYCVAQNPPFGIQRKGQDTVFLKAAAELGARYIVSIHHGGSDKALSYLEGLMNGHGYRLKYVEAFKFPIPAMYRSHVRRIYYTPALLMLFEKRVHRH